MLCRVLSVVVSKRRRACGPQRAGRWRRPARTCLVVAVALAGFRGVDAQIARRPDWIDVNVDPVAVRRLTLAGDAVSAGRWEEAVRLLRDVLRENGDTLIPVDERHLVAARVYALWVVAQLPPEGLAEYRRHVEPLAQRALQEATAKGDVEGLRRIVWSHWGTRAAAVAADRLARRYWGEGELRSAIELWLALAGPEWANAIEGRAPAAEHAATTPDAQAAAGKPRARASAGKFVWLMAPPDLRVPAAAWRLAVTLQALGDRAAANAVANSVLAGAANRGAVEGSSGDDGLREFVDRWNRARLWRDARRPHAGSPTFGQTLERNPWFPRVGTIGAVRWRQPLWFDAQTLEFVQGGTPAIRQLRPACFPVTWRNAVVVGDVLTIRAFRLDSGRPLFADRGATGGLVYPEVVREALIRARNPLTGFPAFTFHESEGRVFARLGAPVTVRAEHEFDLPTAWIGLDFRRGEGKPVWYLPDEALGEPSTSWALEGTPIVYDGRVYGAVRQSQPNSRLLVGCWDLQTHRQLWRKAVAGATTNVEATRNVMTHVLLTMAGGRIVLRTDYGLVAALDAQDGTLLWATATDGQPAAAARAASSFVDRRRPYRLGESDPLPAVAHQQRVFAVGRDRTSVAALSSFNGRLLWRRSLPDVVGHVLGAVGDVLVVSGRGLWALDVHSGRVVWRYRPTSPEAYGYGRGAICGSEVLWPTHDELMGFDLYSGRLLRRVSLRVRGTTGGHLLPCEGVLLISSGDELVALDTVSR